MGTLSSDWYDKVPVLSDTILLFSDTLFSGGGKNGVDCYSKNGHAVTVLTRQS